MPDPLPTADQIFSAMSGVLKNRDLEDFRDLLIVLVAVDPEAAEIIYSTIQTLSPKAEVSSAREALAKALAARNSTAEEPAS